MTLKKRTKSSRDKIGDIVCCHIQDPEKQLVPPF